ncbi:MAG: alpha/beta hydrolase [Vicinamibacterales bacterium]
MTRAEPLSLTNTVRTIAVRTHGRFLIDAADRPVATLVGFHGYQENAAVHLEVLRRIANGRPVNLLSIQALNRFYTRANAVVAGWMTTEDRELVIADNVDYVTAVLAEVAGEGGLTRPLIYAGFSQGVAMAYRAAAFVPRPCDGVIALAGDVPPDVVPVATSLPPVLIGRGTADTWYSAEKLAADTATLRGAGVAVSEHVFAGGHVWDDSFVARAVAFLDERVAATSAPSGG